MWNKHWTETIYIGQWPIFYGPVILPYILKTIWWTNVIIGILDPCDATIYCIKCMWVSDLHFMVHWFCLISRRLLDSSMLYWRYWFSVTQTLTCSYICKSVTYISWSSDFVLYLEDYLMDKCHNWNTGSIWSKDSPDKMYVGQWPLFHGPVILSYLEDYSKDWCCTGDIDSVWYKHWTETIYVSEWTIFNGPVILSYILKTIW